VPVARDVRKFSESVHVKQSVSAFQCFGLTPHFRRLATHNSPLSFSQGDDSVAIALLHEPAPFVFDGL